MGAKNDNRGDVDTWRQATVDRAAGSLGLSQFPRFNPWPTALDVGPHELSGSLGAILSL